MDVRQTIDPAMSFIDENYIPFSAPLFSYNSRLLDDQLLDDQLLDVQLLDDQLPYTQLSYAQSPNLNDTSNYPPASNYESLSLDYNQYDPPIVGFPSTCNPADIMPPPTGFVTLPETEWLEATLGSVDNFNSPLTVAPSQLASPHQYLLSTPYMVDNLLTLDGSNIGLATPPPSERPVHRTLPFEAFDQIYHLSRLDLNAPSPVEAASPASTVSSAAYTPSTPGSHTYDSVSLYNSSEFDSSSPSSSSGSPAPVRRPARAAGVQRVVVSEFRRRRQGNQPVPTGDPERPHGCRHPGLTPEDLPCNLDFARKHDWSRHQVSCVPTSFNVLVLTHPQSL
jgi:hypothetical protein